MKWMKGKTKAEDGGISYSKEGGEKEEREESDMKKKVRKEGDKREKEEKKWCKRKT